MAVAPVALSSTLAAVVADVFSNRTSGSGDEAYDVPTEAQAATLAGAFGKLMTGDYNGAAADVDQFGYDVLLLSDTATGRSHAVLRERLPATRYWGLHAWSLDAGRTSLVVEAPHIKADANTHTEGQSLFDKANAKAFLLSTAHRNSNAALDVDGDRVSDVANADGVVNPFLEIHKVAAPVGSTVVQVHGYADASDPSWDIIVSEGQSSSSAQTQSLAASLRTATGLRVGVYDGTVGSGLGATGNVQGIQSRGIGVYWVHVEQNSTVRTSVTTRGQVEDVLAASLAPSTTAATVPAITRTPQLFTHSATLASSTITASVASITRTPQLFTPSATGGAATALTPASVLNIGPAAGQNHFSVQIAPDGASSIETHDQSEIAAGYTDPQHFFVTSDGWVELSPRADGPTTSGTVYPRDELRELDQSGANMIFDALTGEHWCEARIRIMSAPSEDPDVVVMQLHNGDADRLAVRTQQLSTGVTVYGLRVNGSLVSTRIENPWVPGAEHLIKLRLINGTAELYVDGATTPLITSTALVQTTNPAGWYWKTGAYAQFNNTDAGATGLVPASTARARVHIKDLKHWHTGWPAPAIPAPVVTAAAVPAITRTPTTYAPSASTTVTATLPLIAGAPAIYAPSAGSVTAATVPFLTNAPATFTPAATTTLTATVGLLSRTPVIYTPTSAATLLAAVPLLASSATTFAPGATSVVIVALPTITGTPTAYMPTMSGLLVATVTRLNRTPAIFNPAAVRVTVIGTELLGWLNGQWVQFEAVRWTGRYWELLEPVVEGWGTTAPPPIVAAVAGFGRQPFGNSPFGHGQ